MSRSAKDTEDVLQTRVADESPQADGVLHTDGISGFPYYEGPQA